MSDTSINASAESPDHSISSTRVSSRASYITFPEPHLLSQPIPIPVNQNNSITGVPRQLSTGTLPTPGLQMCPSNLTSHWGDCHPNQFATLSPPPTWTHPRSV